MSTRFDSVGLFWEDAPVATKRGVISRTKPPIPDTGWKPPRDYPRLQDAKILSFDTETKDPELLEKGPGWARKVGHIVGVSLATDDGFKAYYPVRHEEMTELNLDPETTFRWLKEVLETPMPKVGANLLYDVGWLTEENINVAGKLYDVQYAEALLAEASKLELEKLGQKYLGEGKESDILYDWLDAYFGGGATSKQRKWIYKAPPTLVGPYAESDADLPLRILKKQWPLLEQEGLLGLYELECSIIRIVLKMRQGGVRIDLNKEEQMKKLLRDELAGMRKQVKIDTGVDVAIWAADSLAKVFDKAGVPYPRTETGKPSFTAGFLDHLDHPLGERIRTMRQYDKLAGVFIESYLLNSHKNGIVYGQFHQLRAEKGGTRSGRFSSSTPNLQNIPARTELGKQVREIFIPFDGHKQWRKFDYSQIEYRFLTHFAVGEGAEHVREQYRADPDTDFHEAVRQLIHKMTMLLLDRKPTKSINFGLSYGMGIPTLAAQLGIPIKEAKKLFEAYHKGAPFVKATMDHCMQEAQTTGVIKTILGRTSRFELWEPARAGVDGIPLPYAAAVAKYGEVCRAKTYKALNRKLQGSSADQLKLALLQADTAGIFDVIGYPVITVHDELDFSDAGGNLEAWAELQHIMETCLPLRIPVKADCEIGTNWGNVK